MQNIKPPHLPGNATDRAIAKNWMVGICECDEALEKVNEKLNSWGYRNL